MAGASLIPYPAQLFARQILWPRIELGYGEATAFQRGAETQFGADPATADFWGNLAGTGTTVMGRRHGGEMIMGRWRGAAADFALRSMQGFPIFLPLRPLNWAAGVRMPAPWRVIRLGFWFAFDANGGPLPSENSGLMFLPASGVTVDPWVTSGAGTAGFGITFAAGAPVLAAKVGGAYGFHPLAGVPNLEQEPAYFEFEFQAAGGQGAATLALFVNGVQQALPASLSSWGAGTALPFYSDASTANCCQWIPSVQANDGNACDIYVGPLRGIYGNFSVNGQEISS